MLNQNERTVDTTVTTTAAAMAIYISHSITSAKSKLPASAIVTRFIFDNSIHQYDGTFFHLSCQTVNLLEDITVEELQHDGYDDTEDGGYQCYLHTLGNDRRTDVACYLYLVESHHHTYHRTEETQ